MLDARGQRGKTFLPPLIDAIEENLDAGGQTLLFLNRRGFATYLVCEACGHVLRCPNCEVTLTYHRGKGRHVCHYCDYSMPAPSVCPSCQGKEITLLGRGTERVEDEVQELFPLARVARMDRDSTKGKGGHARVLKALEDGSVDILIGTQMIAKGHDFPGVTLVGVVSADASLNLPDFRSAERTFQLVTQVMGRAGRGDKPGRVLVQTLAPEHYALTYAVAHDFEGFYPQEIAFREEVGYPPFAHLAALTLSGVAPAAGGALGPGGGRPAPQDQGGLPAAGGDPGAGHRAAWQGARALPLADPSEGEGAQRTAPDPVPLPGRFQPPLAGAPGGGRGSGRDAVRKRLSMKGNEE